MAPRSSVEKVCVLLEKSVRVGAETVPMAISPGRKERSVSTLLDGSPGMAHLSINLRQG